MYGETVISPRATVLYRGLSPRVRGNLAWLHCALPSDGSIPACTGEPPDDPDACRWRPVYPRVYGGTAAARSSIMPPQGLSPRVRGNRGPCALHYAVQGSIPACTGEPRQGITAIEYGQVYPRVYGGTTAVLPSSVHEPGLSPRVRGNHTGGQAARNTTRSIPACTGEPYVFSFTADSYQGLSPRVRGNRRPRPCGAGR